MLITWDEYKRQANINKHGFDFTDLSEGFFLNAIIQDAKRSRLKALGRLEDGTIAVIFALLGSEAISIISMRPASNMERKLLEAQET
jgi:hypothetical protein